MSSAQRDRAGVPLRRRLHDPRIVALALSVAVFAVYRLTHRGEGDHLNYMTRTADAFLHGRVDLVEHPPWLNELIPYGDGWYAVFPPMPAFICVPFVWVFGAEVSQPMISMLVAAVSAGIAYLALHRIFGPRVGLTATVLYALGTNLWYHAEVGSGWYFAQVCACLFLWSAVLETVTRTRPVMIGALLAAAVLCRVTTIGALAFVVIFAWRTFFPSAAHWPQQRWQALRPDIGAWSGLALGLAPAALIAAWYNQARFGSPTEFGYQLIPGVLDEPWYSHGLVHPSYAPGHLADMFFALPTFTGEWPFVVPSLYTMALWVTTPALVLCLRAPLRNRLTLGAAAGAVCTLPMLVMHGSNGFSQFGNRWSLDYLPFLVLLVAAGMRGRVSRPALALVVASVAVNLWGVVMITIVGRWTF